MPAALGLLAWAALAAFQGLAWGASAAAARWSAQRLPAAARPWAWALIWTAVAVLCERWTPRLAADLLAYTQYRHLALLQLGAWAGPHALGFLVALVNACAADAWSPAEDGERPFFAAANAAAAAALLLAVWVWGAAQLAARASGLKTARVEILQPAVDQYQKWDEDSAAGIVRNFEELLGRGRPRAPSLIVWPETALPYSIEDGAVPRIAAPWSRELGADQLIGVISRAGEARRNSVLLVSEEGALKGAYHKRELVPFGEYVPIAGLESFIGILNQMGGLSAGPPDQALLPTVFGPTAVTVCYENLFPRWARRDAARGAAALVNVTNDGWYKGTWGPYQHYYSNVYRAIENRVTVVRCGNTGISAVIDPWGVATARLELNLRGRLDAEVPVEDAFPRRSLYARAGDWFGLLCLLGAAGLLGGQALAAGRPS